MLQPAGCVRSLLRLAALGGCYETAQLAWRVPCAEADMVQVLRDLRDEERAPEGGVKVGWLC